MSADVNAMSLV